MSDFRTGIWPSCDDHGTKQCNGLVDTGCILVECRLPAEDGAELCSRCQRAAVPSAIHGRTVRKRGEG
jgi:FixJ family two-component response regulator